MRTPVQPPTSALALERTHHFARHGYMVVEEALSAEQCEHWRHKAIELFQRHARHIDRPSGERRLRYRVVVGDVIRREWPELWAFYTSGETLAWVRRLTAAPAVYTSPYSQSAVNINLLGTPGELYPWHFDATPYTLVLFLTTSTVQGGGALQLLPESHSRPISVLPRAGNIVVMDGTRCRHRVTEIVRPHLRLSIPMVFPPTPSHHRTTELDEYLYSETVRHERENRREVGRD